MRLLTTVASLGCCLLAWPAAAERINHEGRLLGSVPVVTNALPFNTPAADGVLAALQIFPPDSPWNEDISRRPVLTNSDAMIAQIVSDLASNRRTLRPFYEMNFVLVPNDQALVPISLFNYPDESDPGPYPIPPNLPIETWPRETGSLTLEQWQRDINNVGGDRHAIIVQPGTGFLWETWLTKLSDTDWQASNGARFNLTNNTLRPLRWTSADAAGLPMFPALVRYDECERGTVEHALRIVVKRTRAQFLYPATHYASVPYTTDPNVPAMGQRLRLKASFIIPDGWAKPEKAVLRALQKHGALVADNGGFFSVSITPDDRWPANAFSHLSSLSITNFEVVQGTGPGEGPRSPGAPQADAGADAIVPLGQPLNLQGTVAFSGGLPAIAWTCYSGPAAVSFGDLHRTNTSVTFSTPGTYTLLLSADDGVHPVAYDAVVVTITTSIAATIKRSGTNLIMDWTGGNPPYVLEKTDTLLPTRWSAVLTTNSPAATWPVSTPSAFFRVQGR